MPGLRHGMPNETEAELALLGIHVWIPIAVMGPQYAERRISSLAEGANLLAEHAKQSAARIGLNFANSRQDLFHLHEYVRYQSRSST